MRWFDGHIDLAYLALEGRDLYKPLSEATQGPQPSAVTFSTLDEGQVRWALGTIFAVPREFAAYGYVKGDLEAIHEQGAKQLAQYHQWEREGGLQVLRRARELAPPVEAQGLQVLLLMEGAEPIREPEEVEWWHRQGVRVIGLSWSIGTRYAGGNRSGGALTEAGRQLVSRMDALGMLHDLSHLSDESAWQLLEIAEGPVLASHSNCRALVDGKDQRHLSDELIRAIEARGGVIGVNLFSRFLHAEGSRRRVTVEETVAHVERICELVGHTRCVALGSDIDGGFGAKYLPVSIDVPADYARLLEALSQRRWSDDDLTAFAHGNWLRFFRENLA